MKVDDKYLQRLGVLPYEQTRPRRRVREVNDPNHPNERRRLRATWTVELEEDLRDIHGLDIEDFAAEFFMQDVTVQEEEQEEEGSLESFRQWLRGMRGNRGN